MIHSALHDPAWASPSDSPTSSPPFPSLQQSVHTTTGFLSLLIAGTRRSLCLDIVPASHPRTYPHAHCFLEKCTYMFQLKHSCFGEPFTARPMPTTKAKPNLHSSLFLLSYACVLDCDCLLVCSGPYSFSPTHIGTALSLTPVSDTSSLVKLVDRIPGWPPWFLLWGYFFSTVTQKLSLTHR